MSGEIIRMGDPTSNGGKVIEGSTVDICHGKPISFIGHQTFCPQCKGTFPIIEGVGTTTFYGHGVALAGMKTACGALLIATQFTDTVEYGGANKNVRAEEPKQASRPGAVGRVAQSAEIPVAPGFDIFFHAKDAATGKGISHAPYKITLDDGRTFEGVSDAQGHTEKVTSDKPIFATIEIPHYDQSATHSNHGSDTCDC